MADVSMYDQEFFTRLATRLVGMSKLQLYEEKKHWTRQTCEQRARVADIRKARSVLGEQFEREETALLIAWENCYKLCQMVEGTKK